MVNEICHFELDVIEAVLNETPQINLITDNIGADYSLLSLVEVIKNDASNIYRYQYINSCFNLIATVDIHIKEDNLSIDVIGE